MTIRLWDFLLKPLRAISSETYPTSLAAHPNGNWLLSGNGAFPNRVNVWNIRTGKFT